MERDFDEGYIVEYCWRGIDVFEDEILLETEILLKTK